MQSNEYIVLSNATKQFIVNCFFKEVAEKCLLNRHEFYLICISEIVIDKENGTVLKNRYGNIYYKKLPLIARIKKWFSKKH